MTNAYTTLTAIKSLGGLNITSADANSRDAQLRRFIETASRRCDDYCGRRFYPFTQTMYFSGNGQRSLALPADLISVTSLTEDQDGNATYETTWATTDYELAPYDANPASGTVDLARPYWEIEVNRRSTGAQYWFGSGQKRFALAGIWGYCRSLALSSATVNGAHTAAVTTLNVSDGTQFEVGQTLVIGSEQLYVTAISANALTVERGVNGTTAASIATLAAISVLQYPSWLVQATLVEASRLWKLKDSAFASSLGIPETGVVQTFGGALHPQARALLDPYRILGV